jgi:hypothetical protein
VQFQRTTSSQNSLTENFSRNTVDAPLTSIDPTATMPPMLWCIGKQSYMRSSDPTFIMPANQ